MSGSPAAASKRRQPVFLREDVVDDRAGLDHARPADEHRHAEAAFPGRALLAVERRGAAVRPRHRFRAVVGAIDDDGIVRDAQVIELFQDLRRPCRRAPPCRRHRC